MTDVIEEIKEDGKELSKWKEGFFTGIGISILFTILLTAIRSCF
jgi:hypothetical protein